MAKKKTKKVNLILLIIKMFLLLCITFLAAQLLPTFIQGAIEVSRYGNQLIGEMLMAAVAFVVMLLAKNSYVIKDEHEGFFRSLAIAMPLLIYSIIIFIGALPNITNAKVYDVVTLALMCLFIGIFEEFMCRGWLQNEFIEKYGSNRKEVWTSILITAFAFGFLHMVNILVGQSIFMTIIQVISAASFGVYIGAVYYRTKNIWACVFLHGFWDFAVLGRTIDLIRECGEGTPSKEMLIIYFVSVAFEFIAYLYLAKYLLRKSKTYKMFDERKPERDKEGKKYIAIAVVAFVAMLLLPAPEGEEDYEVCFDYEEREIGDFSTIYTSYSTYSVSNGEVMLYFEFNDDEMIITNVKTEKSVKIDDYASNFVVIENGSRVEMAFLTDDLVDYTIAYSDFINKDEMDNSEEYLNKVADSFKYHNEIASPTKIGYLIDRSNGKKYIFTTDEGHNPFVFENNSVYLLKIVEVEKDTYKPSDVQKGDLAEMTENALQVQGALKRNNNKKVLNTYDVVVEN